MNSAEEVMKESARKIHTKAKRLLQLYSLWHETHNDRVKRQYMVLLGQILRIEPRFNPQSEFQKAF